MAVRRSLNLCGGTSRRSGRLMSWPPCRRTLRCPHGRIMLPKLSAVRARPHAFRRARGACSSRRALK